MRDQSWCYSEKSKLLSEKWYDKFGNVYNEDNYLLISYRTRGIAKVDFHNIDIDDVKRIKQFDIMMNSSIECLCYPSVGEIKQRSRFAICIYGPSRKGYNTHWQKNLITCKCDAGVFWVNLMVGSFSFPEKKFIFNLRPTSLYIGEVGGFLNNKELTDKVYQKALEIHKLFKKNLKKKHNVTIDNFEITRIGL